MTNKWIYEVAEIVPDDAVYLNGKWVSKSKKTVRYFIMAKTKGGYFDLSLLHGTYESKTEAEKIAAGLNRDAK